MVTLQWLEVVNTLQHLPQKSCSNKQLNPAVKSLKCICFPYLKPIFSIDSLTKPQTPVQPSRPLTCLTTQSKTGWLWRKGVTEPEYKGLTFKQVQ